MGYAPYEQCPFIAPGLEVIDTASERLGMLQLTHDDSISRARNTLVEWAHFDEMFEYFQETTESLSDAVGLQASRDRMAASKKMFEEQSLRLETTYASATTAIEGSVAASQALIDLVCGSCKGEPRRFLGRLICGSSAVPLAERIIKGFPEGEK